MPETYEGKTFIQWKGTDVCLDLYCPTCGHHSHVDALGAYSVRCPSCRTVWRLGDSVTLTRVPEGEQDGDPVDAD